MNYFQKENGRINSHDLIQSCINIHFTNEKKKGTEA
jgi:hypothetical protein